MIDLEHERAQLLQEMKATKGSRFNAAERLRKRDRTRTVITAFASVYVIVLTVIPLAFHLPDIIDNILNVTVIIFSVIILTSSLLQYSSGDPVRAEQHHRCALEINSLRRELRIFDLTKIADLETFSKNYDEIIQRFNINHEPVDFERYKVEHPDEYPRLNPTEEKKTLEDDIKRENRFLQSVLSSMTAAFTLAVIGSLMSTVFSGVPIDQVFKGVFYRIFHSLF